MTGPSLAFVGDLHGCHENLPEILHKYGGKRHLIFLGDYVNRGPDSREVIESLVVAKLRWPSSITFLRGNHDQAVLDFISGGDLAKFVRYGGLSTVASYVEEDFADADIFETFNQAFPRSHIQFLIELEDYFERDDVFASHCGPDPSRPHARDRRTVALSSHPQLFNAENAGIFGKPVVCGHYVQRGGKAHITQWLAAIDTGCGSLPGGPLTLLLWPERDTVSYGGDE